MTVGHASFSKEKFDQSTAAIAYRWGNLFREYLAGMSALDFGCGYGRIAEILLREGRVSKVSGTDIVPFAINEARKHVPSGEFRLFDGKRIPFSAGTFDGVISWTVLQHIPDGEVGAIAAEISRVLKKNGIFFLYENTSDIACKGHVFFRKVGDYVALFPKLSAFHIEEVPNFDGTGEMHSLVGLRRWC